MPYRESYRESIHETDAGTFRLTGRPRIHATAAEAGIEADWLDARDHFLAMVVEFGSAGARLTEAWDGNGGFNADDAAPLPAHLVPPMSLDDWFPAFVAHYEETMPEARPAPASPRVPAFGDPDWSEAEEEERLERERRERVADGEEEATLADAIRDLQHLADEGDPEAAELVGRLHEQLARRRS